MDGVVKFEKLSVLKKMMKMTFSARAPSPPLPPISLLGVGRGKKRGVGICEETTSTKTTKELQNKNKQHKTKQRKQTNKTNETRKKNNNKNKQT